jgi:hypothetical protein
MRQEEDSGILYNATELRELLKDPSLLISSLMLRSSKTLFLIDGYDIQDAINSAYSNYSIEDTAFSFVLIKGQINTTSKYELKLDKESELSTGDFFDGGQKQLFLVEKKRMKLDLLLMVLLRYSKF